MKSILYTALSIFCICFALEAQSAGLNSDCVVGDDGIVRRTTENQTSICRAGTEDATRFCSEYCNQPEHAAVCGRAKAHLTTPREFAEIAVQSSGAVIQETKYPDIYIDDPRVKYERLDEMGDSQESRVFSMFKPKFMTIYKFITTDKIQYAAVDFYYKCPDKAHMPGDLGKYAFISVDGEIFNGRNAEFAGYRETGGGDFAVHCTIEH